MQGKLTDLTGRTFGRLLVIDRAGTQSNNATWNVMCICGEGRAMMAHNLISGTSTSCGCRRTESNTTHGMSGSIIYQCYYEMVARCHKEDHPSYPNWGGRGIAVCDEWRGEGGRQAWIDYITGLEHGENYDENWKRTDGRSLDRIDNDGDYKPGNLRWATAKEQANNKRKKE